MLFNATKLSPPFSTVKVQINVVQLQDDDRQKLISVIVQDKGPSLSESDIQKLFDPFIESGESSLGPGLGLYTSKLICEKLGGDICYFSEGPFSGNCTEFRIRVKQGKY